MSKKKATNKPSASAKETYERLKSDRSPYITRAEDCAKYTIPSLFPKESDTGSTVYSTPYQSIGARGVNNLASKLLLALLPANAAFFRLSAIDAAKQELMSASPDALAKTEAALSKIERIVMMYVETHQIRATVAEAIKQLVVAGNALLFLPPKIGGIKCYRLNSYVLQRDALGNVINLVTVDKMSYAAVPDDLKGLVANGKAMKPEDPVEIYTHVYRDGMLYQSYQEVEGVTISGTEGSYPLEETPWIPMRMVKVDGEAYGRSFVEEYLGDIKSLEGLSKAIVEMSAIAANIIFLVNPNGVTRVAKVAKAAAGDFVSGRAADIETIQINKYADLQVAKATADGIEGRLSYAFMLNSAVQRQGERVTAEEIRYVAGELEDTLGGVYSVLSQEFQLPLVRRLLVQLTSMKLLPDLPKGVVSPSITTGMEALGRGHDLNRLVTFVDLAAKIPEAANRLKLDGILQMIGTSLSLTTENLVKSDEEIQQEQQMMQMMQIAQAGAPQLAKGFADAQLQQQPGQ